MASAGLPLLTQSGHWARPAQPPPSPTCVNGAQNIGWAYRERLEAVPVSRISAEKDIWRARIILLSANGVGAMEMRGEHRWGLQA